VLLAVKTEPFVGAALQVGKGAFAFGQDVDLGEFAFVLADAIQAIDVLVCASSAKIAIPTHASHP
jgi:hypothetical protein